MASTRLRPPSICAEPWANVESDRDDKSSVASSRAFFAPRIRCVHLPQIVAQLFGGQVVGRRLP